MSPDEALSRALCATIGDDPERIVQSTGKPAWQMYAPWVQRSLEALSSAGFTIAPKEATEAMREAFRASIWADNSTFKDAYTAMISSLSQDATG